MVSSVVTQKPVIYAPVPVFDQSAQYVVQLAPVEMEDHFFVGVEVKQMEISEQDVFAGIMP